MEHFSISGRAIQGHLRTGQMGEIGSLLERYTKGSSEQIRGHGTLFWPAGHGQVFTGHSEARDTFSNSRLETGDFFVQRTCPLRNMGESIECHIVEKGLA